MLAKEQDDAHRNMNRVKRIEGVLERGNISENFH